MPDPSSSLIGGIQSATCRISSAPSRHWLLPPDPFSPHPLFAEESIGACTIDPNLLRNIPSLPLPRRRPVCADRRPPSLRCKRFGRVLFSARGLMFPSSGLEVQSRLLVALPRTDCAPLRVQVTTFDVGEFFLRSFFSRTFGLQMSQ